MLQFAGSADLHNSEVQGHAILDGGVTPALPPCNPRLPAYSAAGSLRQPDFGMQKASTVGQTSKGDAAGEHLARKAGSFLAMQTGVAAQMSAMRTML